ncbi:IBR domain containing 3 (predicted) [Rattus norvegicus]|uniref:IBR domain containing 3 (Predicted) n=1 Tax=Rattus norvegicus TaxID=10116 RepID=A6ISH1_RAT|nr:IBR domain containing 3 (predicted) [Rattus norvegicus]|eukprot:NP_001101473.1 E3 ubiquitin-protein ligase RNF19B [Rattus norvegicus]
MASKPDLRHGPSTEGSDITSSDQAHFGSQLRARIWTSPSGCTFWGKKPWSRKKKILWQLGTLIGAPVGISLIAGIAIPAMVIGIPVYVGRKIHSRYEGRKTSKHKRNLAITGGVTLSVIASPVIAAVSVGIGVPIMLAYVYGVVPISLCRGGGCGVSTANGKGVKIEFDEDDGPITVADAWRALKNPSIGESSIEGLTSVLSTSGSPTDGLSVMQGPYSETASFAALSGGTLSGGILSSGKGKYSRLEVQADVQKEIFPKDTASLGAISDSASTRAMAGSIISSYNPQDRECNNMEIQVDIEAKPSHYQLVYLLPCAVKDGASRQQPLGKMISGSTGYLVFPCTLAQEMLIMDLASQ